MNIRRPQINRVLQHLVNKADDRGIFGCRVEICILITPFIDDLKRSLFAQRIGSDGEPERDCRARFCASKAESCFASTIRSSNSFTAFWLSTSLIFTYDPFSLSPIGEEGPG